MALVTKSKKPVLAHHKKRNGQHHKHSKPYAKAYWPYLPMLALIGMGFLLNMLWPAAGGVLAYATSMSPSALLQETNVQRSNSGQKTLAVHPQLTSAAQSKANDMAARGYWSHVTPEGVEPWWFVTNAGYSYLATGENLAYGFDNSQATVTGWMNSPGHRANVLNDAYQDVGFGIANVAEYQGQGPATIVVALYGKPASQAAAATAPANTSPLPATSQAAPRNQITPPSVPPEPLSAQPAPLPATINPVSPSVAPPAGTAAATTDAATSNPANPYGADQRVARLQLVAADISPWSVLATTLIIAVAAGIFILRHMYFWHRALVKGERFIIRHWKLDMVIVGIVIIGSLLTRTAGFIQ